MATAETNFDGVIADQFADYAEQVRGYMRYEMVHRNLGTIVAGNSLNIIDIGGGAGIDSIWLAEQGHAVMLAEPANDQRAKAETKLADLPTEIRKQITITQATTTDLLHSGKGESFDLVMSHGVAMYLPDPASYIQELVDLTRPGGHVSLLEKGYHGTEARLIRLGDLDGLRFLKRTQKFRQHNLGREVHAFLPQDIIGMLRSAGIPASSIEWLGVRISTDFMEQPVDSIEPSALELLVQTESEQGRNKSSRGLGQMLHFIAQKK